MSTVTILLAVGVSLLICAAATLYATYKIAKNKYRPS